MDNRRSPYWSGIACFAAFVLAVCASGFFYGCDVTALPSPEQVSVPTFNPATGSYPSVRLVSIECATPEAIIHFTTDGTTPSTGSSIYGAAIPLNGPSTTVWIRAIATRRGMADSAESSAIYQIDYTDGEEVPASSRITYSGAALVSWGSHLYVMGGMDTAGTYRAEVWRTEIDAAGLPGAWVRETDLPEALAFASSVSFGQMVYLIGGRNAGGLRDRIYYTLINADGTLGFTSGWAKNPRSLPKAISGATPRIMQGRVFLSGDESNQGAYVPVINAGFWRDGQLGQWYERSTAFPVFLPETAAIGSTSISLAHSVFSVDEIRGSESPKLGIRMLENRIADPPRVAPGDGNVRTNSKIKIVAFPGDTVRYTVSAYGSIPVDPTETDPDTLWDRTPSALPAITVDSAWAFRAFRSGSEPSEIVYVHYRAMAANMFVLIQGTVFPQATTAGLSAHSLTETYSDGSSLPVSSVWLQLLVDARSPLTLYWQDADGNADAWSASVRVSLYEDSSASRPALTADGTELYRLSAGETAPVAVILGPGPYYIKIESTDGSTGGTFGLVVQKGD